MRENADYEIYLNEINDAKLLLLANDRLKNLDDENLISEDEHKKKYGITSQMLEGFAEVEFE